ncbi:MAG: SatD family protein [Bacillota bacterium]|nr:SatD family protein [Bacillota bacterium]
MYCAIIGDIVGSKKIKNRQEIQDKFNDVLNNANKLYNESIASNFTITLGDEFQGLLIKPSLSLEIIEFIRGKMHPIELVFGIGVGQMGTKFSKDISIGSDGPAYWYARKMVEKAKNKKPSICFFSDSQEDELINTLILISETCINNQTKKQQEIIKLYKELGSQYKVAEKLNISQGSVSATLKKSLYKEIESTKENIKEFLKSKWKE